MRKVLRLGYGGVLLTMLLILAILGVLLLTEPPPPEEEITVVGGEIESNESAVWEWTQSELDRQVNTTPDISIRDLSTADVSSKGGLDGFESVLVADPDASELEGQPTGVTAIPNRVGIHEGALPTEWNDSETTRFNQLLAHEFTHLVQYDSEAFLENRPDEDTSDDERRAFLALSEGSATFVADRYENDSRIDPLRERWTDPDTTITERYSLWPYLRGAEYAATSVDDPSELWPLYADPPQSTATVLRGNPPGDGPPDRELEVELANHSIWRESTVGAAFVESALASSTDADRARSIAEGWRWDAAVRIEKGNTGGVAQRWTWVTEWANATAADGFESEIGGFLDDSWSRSNGTWNHPTEDRVAAIQRVDDDAVAITIASEQFHSNATVTTTEDGYAITSASTNESTAGAAVAPDAVPATRAVA